MTNSRKVAKKDRIVKKIEKAKGEKEYHEGLLPTTPMSTLVALRIMERVNNKNNSDHQIMLEMNETIACRMEIQFQEDQIKKLNKKLEAVNKALSTTSVAEENKSESHKTTESKTGAHESSSENIIINKKR